MARTPQNLDVRQIASTTLTTIYTSTGVVTSGMSLILTNTVVTANNISVFHNDGATDRLLSIPTLVGGNGKEKIVQPIAVLKLNAGHSIKIQASAATAFNSNLSGSLIT
jgi:hypothetical protein